MSLGAVLSPLVSFLTLHRPYVPPRAAWAAATARGGTPPQNFARPLSPIHASPVEMPTQQSPGSHQIPMHTLSHSPPPDSDTFPPSPLSPINPSSHVRMNSSGDYYEDVDPRFTDPAPPSQPVTSIPRSLTPGGGSKPSPVNGLSSQPSNIHPPLPGHLEPSNSYESMQEGPRSPTASDASNYTSISQRGVDPNWRSPPLAGASGMGIGGIQNRRPVQQQQQPTDVLQTNPDFELPRGPRR